jgi:hypothetical protein
MKRFSYNTTGLSPVLKKPHPTTKGQENRKSGAKQEQPWIVQVSRKNYNNNKKPTANSNTYKQQLISITYSSAFSSVGPPLSLLKGECKRDQESVAETAAATDSINLSDDRQRRSTTSTIVNAPARNNRGIDKENQGLTATVTGSLFQKMVTVAAANLGSCDKNPGMADTTMDKGAIFKKRRQLKEVRSEGRRRKKRSGRHQAGRGETFKKLEK